MIQRKKKEIKHEYTKLFKWMWGGKMSEIEAVEIMKYMGWTYDQLMTTPILIIETIKIRMSLEAQQSKNVK